MNVDRMRIVERVLEQVIEKELPFYMGSWTSLDDDRTTYEDCGTCACAAGWTARDPEAQATGLQLFRGVPMYGSGGAGERAMAAWLDIPRHQSEWLFMPMSYDEDAGEDMGEITPQMVLERVRELLA